MESSFIRSPAERELLGDLRISRIVQRAKLARRWDSIVFNPESHLLEIWTKRNGERQLLLSTSCFWVKDRKHFRDLVQLVGLVAEPKLTTMIEDQSAQGPCWAYQYV